MPDTAKVGTVVRQDPLLTFSKAGKPVTKFSLAVKPYAPKGSPPPETIYYDVVTFGEMAEHVSESIHKGDRVVVIGNGKVDTWTGKDGKERQTKVIMADGVGADLRFNSWMRVESGDGPAFSTAPFDEDPDPVF